MDEPKRIGNLQLRDFVLFRHYIKMRGVAVCSVRPTVYRFSFLELDLPGYGGLNCKNVKVRFVAVAQISEIR